VQPDLGLITFVYTVGFHGLLAGVSLIGYAFRTKGGCSPPVLALLSLSGSVSPFAAARAAGDDETW
jgi:hypothetical protein